MEPLLDSRTDLSDEDFAYQLGVTSPEQAQLCRAIRKAFAELCRLPAPRLYPMDQLRQLVEHVRNWDQLAFVLSVEESTGLAFDDEREPFPLLADSSFFGWKLKRAPATFGEWCLQTCHVLERCIIAAPPFETQVSTWCLVGNIVQHHPFGEEKEIRHGTKHFSAGTKVYCFPAEWGDGYEYIRVIGIARKPRRWIEIVMPSRHITSWRAQVVYKPAVVRRIFRARAGYRKPWNSREEVEQYVHFLKKREALTDANR